MRAIHCGLISLPVKQLPIRATLCAWGLSAKGGLPANRSNGSDPVKKVSNDKLVKHEHHANAAEKGETANIKQNTTNKGFFRGRRFG
jgi:hypothetical protein